jgi:hypothetical protein
VTQKSVNGCGAVGAALEAVEAERPAFFAAQSDQVRAVAGIPAQNSVLLAGPVTALLGEVQAA